MAFFFKLKREKNVKAKRWDDAVAGKEMIWRLFSVRRSGFSLEIRAIRPSAVFGTRRRTALYGEGLISA